MLGPLPPWQGSPVRTQERNVGMTRQGPDSAWRKIYKAGCPCRVERLGLARLPQPGQMIRVPLDYKDCHSLEGAGVLPVTVVS